MKYYIEIVFLKYLKPVVLPFNIVPFCACKTNLSKNLKAFVVGGRERENKEWKGV